MNPNRPKSQMKMTTNCISSASFITLLKKSIPLHSAKHVTTTHHFHLHHACPLSLPSNICPNFLLLPIASSSTSSPMSTFTTPPEFPTRRIQEVDPSTPPEIPQAPTEPDPDPFTVVPEPEINPPLPPIDPTPIPPGPEIPQPPIPSPPGPDIIPPPEAPPPHQPPDVVPPNPPEIFPPPTPTPDIIPPTGPVVV